MQIRIHRVIQERQTFNRFRVAESDRIFNSSLQRFLIKRRHFIADFIIFPLFHCGEEYVGAKQ